ncbi:MAG: aspartate carbamoyltransferase [Spirochaetaceae bacterium]|jgi:aspartate carbamoyltransferase catalytic subunit|nr:aspartate carbamoyltransferase [Spirochaetaceae bacterium]
MFKGRSLIEPDDFTIEELEELLLLTKKIREDREKFSESCRKRILAALFFEPSTRTRLSFEAAMLRLGGSCLGFADPSSSSAAKGESLADTIRVVSSYADIAVIRSPKEGAALLAKQYSSIPIINAGDGGHYHPTQTLTDLATIKQFYGSFEGITAGFCGDLKFGRTVHSLAKILTRYKKVKIIFISPKELGVPAYIKDILNKRNIQYSETACLEEVMGELDILYMTRVQRERFLNEEEYLRLKDTYILTPEKMKAAKPTMIVLHPLPRLNEIDVEVDADPRAVYFKQAEYGMYVRMALLALLLDAV